jgi:hypothetical protein
LLELGNNFEPPYFEVGHAKEIWGPQFGGPYWIALTERKGLSIGFVWLYFSSNSLEKHYWLVPEVVVV